MKGLSLVHGGLKPQNIFFKRKGVPEFKLIDFSSAFFLDDKPEEILAVRGSYRAPELDLYSQAKTEEEKAGISLEKVDHWALGALLYELHFKEPIDTSDVEGSLSRAVRDLNLAHSNYWRFRSLIAGLLETDPQ